MSEIFTTAIFSSNTLIFLQLLEIHRQGRAKSSEFFTVSRVATPLHGLIRATMHAHLLKISSEKPEG
jgi:hypothetical protein